MSLCCGENDLEHGEDKHEDFDVDKGRERADAVGEEAMAQAPSGE